MGCTGNPPQASRRARWVPIAEAASRISSQFGRIPWLSLPVLFSQTDNANGGAIDYFDKGVLKNGFALIAWPAEYGVSGVMTFIVNQDGVVFQKDLGDDTDKAVAGIDAYDPDPTWVAVTESDDEADDAADAAPAS
jgi:hypothetical protein